MAVPGLMCRHKKMEKSIAGVSPSCTAALALGGRQRSKLTRTGNGGQWTIRWSSTADLTNIFSPMMNSNGVNDGLSWTPSTYVQTGDFIHLRQTNNDASDGTVTPVLSVVLKTSLSLLLANDNVELHIGGTGAIRGSLSIDGTSIGAFGPSSAFGNDQGITAYTVQNDSPTVSIVMKQSCNPGTCMAIPGVGFDVRLLSR